MPGPNQEVAQDSAVRNVVTLDLWLTLITEPPSISTDGADRNATRRSLLIEALAAAGHSVTEDDVESSFQRVRGDMDHAHANGVDRTFPLWVRQIVDYTLPGVFDTLPEEAADSIIAAIDEPFLTAPPTPHPAATEVLNALSGAGLRVALISNTGFTSGDIYRKWFDELGWSDRFEVTTFSNEAAVAKPSGSIFTDTLDEMGARPAEARDRTRSIPRR